MAELVLYYAPVTCARITLVALEEAGAPYELRLVNMAKGEQRSPAYRAVNPKAKVPAFLVDGALLTETPAILTWLARTYPEAELLPLGRGAFEDALVQSDLTFASAGLHPLTTRLCLPHMFCDIAGGPERVHAMAAAAMIPNLAIAERRLGESEWWYGDRWSMMDVYINWIWYRVTSTAFDVSAYPSLARHAEQLAGRPSVRRAEKRGAAAMAALSVAAA